MSENVVTFPGSEDGTLLKNGRREGVSSRSVLEAALPSVDDMDEVIIIGAMKDGTLFGGCSSDHTADSLMLLERARQKLMRQFADDQWSGTRDG